MVNVIDASVVGNVPPEAMAAFGAERNNPPPPSVETAVMVPPALVVAVRSAVDGLNPEKSIAGLLRFVAATLTAPPPTACTVAKADAVPHPAPPATTDPDTMV
jgi:hypothetical protein